MENSSKREMGLIKLGKLANGVGLFSFADMTKIIMETDDKGDITITFDTEKYDENHCSNWYSKDFLINRKQNINICKELDLLYYNYLSIISANLKGYNIKFNNEVKQSYSLCRTVSGDKLEIMYPSEDSSIKWASALGIIKYDKNNYVLRFHRSMIEPKKQTVLIKNKESRYPELYWLYNSFVRKISKLPIIPFEMLDKHFYNSDCDITKEEINGQQLKPTIRH